MGGAAVTWRFVENLSQGEKDQDYFIWSSSDNPSCCTPSLTPDIHKGLGLQAVGFRVAWLKESCQL